MPDAAMPEQGEEGSATSTTAMGMARCSTAGAKSNPTQLRWAGLGLNLNLADRTVVDL